jgi:hypothetical protein
MTHKAKDTVCSEIRTKHSTQSDHNVEFFKMLNLVVRKEAARF